MSDKSGIYLRFIWDVSRIYPGFIYIPDKSRIYPKYIPEYILNISGIYSQIYLGFQGWGIALTIYNTLTKTAFHGVSRGFSNTNNVSLGPAIPYLSMPCGRQLENWPPT
jgi:hypothetical protein